MPVILHLVGFIALVIGAYRGYKSHGNATRALRVPLVLVSLAVLTDRGGLGLIPPGVFIPDLLQTLVLLRFLRWPIAGAAVIWGIRESVRYSGSPANIVAANGQVGSVDLQQTRLGLTSVVCGLVAVAAGGFAGATMLLSLFLTLKDSGVLLAQEASAILMWMSPVAWFPSILCGHLGLLDVKSGRRRGRRLARTGLWLGYAGLAAMVLVRSKLLLQIVIVIAAINGYG